MREVDIAASPEVVFAFFVDADKLGRWLAVSATLDPRPGGVCHQQHDRGVPGAPPFHMVGEFLEVDPPRRVVFTWGFTEPEVGVPPGSSRVEVTLRPTASGTRVRLEHHDLPEPEVPSHAGGWTRMLARLAEIAGATTLTMEHEVWIEADPHAVYEALTTKDGLDAWWGKVVTAEPTVGSTVEFDHGLGAPLLMEVIELVPDRKVVWRCTSEFTDPTNPASEWRGQVLTFELSPRASVELLGTAHDVTVLRFRVTGWPSGARWFGFCNTAWGETLGGKLRTAVAPGS